MRMRDRKLVSALAVLSLSMMGLAMGGDVTVKPRIIDGTNVPNSQFPTVGLMTDANQSFTCTATLIAPRFILTAAHCVVNGRGQQDLVPSDMRIQFGGVTYSGSKITFNSTYHGNISQEAEGAIDLAVIELNKDVPGITPSPIARTAPTVGTVLTLVGFGEQGSGNTGGNNTFPADGTVNMGKSPIDIVTPTFVKWNFENKPAPNQESNTAPGDSGGPQFVSNNGVLTIVSVTSGGNDPNSKFGDLSYNTRVDIAASWIDSIVNGGSGGPNPTNNPPSIVSLSASSTAPAEGAEVSFSAAASDPDGDPLTYQWNFGDGTSLTTSTGTAVHIYVASGPVTVQLVVSDGKGGTAQATIDLSVGIVQVLVTKKKFNLNFTSPSKDSIDFTILDSKFAFASKFDFQDALTGAQIKVFIDTTEIDSMSLLDGTKAVGKGTVSFTTKQGYVRYSVRSNSDLEKLLAKYGAVNDTITSNVIVPVRIQVAGTRYGGDAAFIYKAKFGKSGAGK